MSKYSPFDGTGIEDLPVRPPEPLSRVTEEPCGGCTSQCTLFPRCRTQSVDKEARSLARVRGAAEPTSWDKVVPRLGMIADDLYAELGRRVSDAMAGAGEDPKNEQLFHIRVQQAASIIRGAAERARGSY